MQGILSLHFNRVSISICNHHSFAKFSLTEHHEILRSGNIFTNTIK